MARAPESLERAGSCVVCFAQNVSSLNALGRPVVYEGTNEPTSTLKWCSHLPMMCRDDSSKDSLTAKLYDMRCSSGASGSFAPYISRILP